MPMIRSLRQPGPVHPQRMDCCFGEMEQLQFALTAGATLNEAVKEAALAVDGRAIHI